MSEPTTDLIVLNPGQVAVSLDLRNNSALAGCTKVDGNGSGRVFVAKSWPGLSSGEDRLWAVLAWLNGHGAYPDIDDLRAHLDDPSFEAAYRAVTTS